MRARAVASMRLHAMHAIAGLGTDLTGVHRARLSSVREPPLARRVGMRTNPSHSTLACSPRGALCSLEHLPLSANLASALVPSRMHGLIQHVHLYDEGAKCRGRGGLDGAPKAPSCAPGLLGRTSLS